VTKGRWARKQPSVKECVIAHPWSYTAPKMCGTKWHADTLEGSFNVPVVFTRLGSNFNFNFKPGLSPGLKGQVKKAWS